jgi:hypothetical protein
MNNLDMLLAVKGDVTKAKSHLLEHYFPLSTYKSKVGLSDSSVIILNLQSDDSDAISYFKVTGDSITECNYETYSQLLSESLESNCTLYNLPAPPVSLLPRYFIKVK